MARALPHGPIGIAVAAVGTGPPVRAILETFILETLILEAFLLDTWSPQELRVDLEHPQQGDRNP